MNIYRFRWFLSKKHWGKTYKIFKNLKKAQPFKRAHFTVYIPHKNCDKVIIALGQMHTVLSGKISGWSAKKIGKNQARLFTYYRYLFQQFGIQVFGEEGVTHAMTDKLFRYNLTNLQKELSPNEKNTIVKKQASFAFIKKILVRFAKKWKTMLKLFRSAPEKVSHSADLVSGALLYSLENPQIQFFAVEGEKAYRFTLNKITSLEKEITQIKRTQAFQNAIAKQYKNLTQEEYDAVVLANTKVKLFNKFLGSTLRDEATLNSMIAHLEHEDIVVYTIGMAHKKNLFKLANGMLQQHNIGLIMIIPPELWFWQGVILWLKRLIILAIILLCSGYVYFN